MGSLQFFWIQFSTIILQNQIKLLINHYNFDPLARNQNFHQGYLSLLLEKRANLVGARKNPPSHLGCRESWLPKIGYHFGFNALHEKILEIQLYLTKNSIWKRNNDLYVKIEKVLATKDYSKFLEGKN